MTFKQTLISKKALLIALPILAIIIIYLTLVFPWPTSQNVTGTMGGVDDGVQRAKKYRSEQMTEADVVLKNPDFQKIVQTDEFQKLLKNEEFIKFTASGNLSKLAKLNIVGLTGDANFVELLSQQSFAAICNNKTFSQIAGLQPFIVLFCDRNMNAALQKGQFEKIELNVLFKNLMKSPELAQSNLHMNAILTLMKSEDYKNVVASQAFNTLINNQMFLTCLKSGSLNNFPDHFALSNWYNLGIQNLISRQNFVGLVLSKEFTNLAKDGNLQILSNNLQHQSH